MGRPTCSSFSLTKVLLITSATPRLYHCGSRRGNALVKTRFA